MIGNPSTADAGPELDTVIAIEVMGWKRAEILNVDPGGQSYPSMSRTFMPSTNANDALIVAEKSGVLGWPSTTCHDGSPAVWAIDDGAYQTFAMAPTFPLLICRAALLKVRGAKS